MRCRNCGQPIEYCRRDHPLPIPCSGTRHTQTGIHFCGDLHDVCTSVAASVALDGLEAIDGPGYEARREYLESWGAS